MKIVTVLMRGFDTKTVGEKKAIKYVFHAMETDLNGARIPVELQTFSEDIKNKLLSHANSGEEQILVPFTMSSVFAGKTQYTIDSIITHPDYSL